jgi:hypothetical protein
LPCVAQRLESGATRLARAPRRSELDVLFGAPSAHSRREIDPSFRENRPHIVIRFDAGHDTMTTLRFVGEDYRWLLETLVEACEVTSREGERPEIVVNGKVFRPLGLLKVAQLLPDEALQPHHQVMMDELFKKKQSGYRRTAFNLAHRANSIASSRQARAAMEALAKEGLLAAKSGDTSRRRRS